MTTIIYRYEVDKVTRYVGSTFDYGYRDRKSWHKRKLNAKRNISADRIKFFILETCEDNIRFEREAFYIEQCKDLGYELWNVCDPLKEFPSNILRGGHHSEESRKKISEARSKRSITKRERVFKTKEKRVPKSKNEKAIKTKKEKVTKTKRIRYVKVDPLMDKRKLPFSEEHKKKLSESHKGKNCKPRSEEVRRKISIGNKGKIFTEEHKKRISESHKGKPSPFKGKLGKPCSVETRKKISIALNGNTNGKSNRGKSNPEQSLRMKGNTNNKGKRMLARSITNESIREIQSSYVKNGEPCSWEYASHIWRKMMKKDS